MAVPVTSGLVGHWDADAITGLSNNDPVNTWPDETAEGNDLTPTSNAPTYVTNVLNGLPAVRFDDSLVSVTLASTITSGRTAFAMIHNPSNDSTHRRWLDGNGGLLMVKWNNDDRWLMGGGAAGSQWLDFLDATLLDIDCFWSMTIDASDNVVVRANGTQKASEQLGDAASDLSAFGVGGALNNVDRRFAGDIFEILLYDRVLTAQEISDTEDYLNDKWLTAGGTTVAVGTLAEANSPVSVAAEKPIEQAVGVLTETNTPNAVAATHVAGVGTMAEAGALTGVASAKTAPVGVLAETGALQPAAAVKTAGVGTLAETDALIDVAALLGGDQTIAVAPLAEVGALVGVSGTKIAPVGTLAETQALQPVTAGHRIVVGTLTEVGQLVSAGVAKIVTVGTLGETGELVAVAVVQPVVVAVGTLAEADQLVAVAAVVGAVKFWQKDPVDWTPNRVVYTPAAPGDPSPF